MTRRQFIGELVEAGAFAVGAVIVALIGEPQPLAILTAAAGGLTALVIAARAIEARSEFLRRRGRGGWEQ